MKIVKVSAFILLKRLKEYDVEKRLNFYTKKTSGADDENEALEKRFLLSST